MCYVQISSPHQVHFLLKSFSFLKFLFELPELSQTRAACPQYRQESGDTHTLRKLQGPGIQLHFSMRVFRLSPPQTKPLHPCRTVPPP